MTLRTALSGVVQYARSERLGGQLTLYGTVIGHVSGQVGQQLMGAAPKESWRPSMVVFLLGGTASAACVAMTLQKERTLSRLMRTASSAMSDLAGIIAGGLVSLGIGSVYSSEFVQIPSLRLAMAT